MFAAACALLVGTLPCGVHAQDLVRGSTEDTAPEPERLEIVGRADDIIGVATSSSEGVVGAADLAARPVLRPGEIMETIPGVIVTQHSGSGKANQYFLRGFNLDHGTDLASDFEGMPINMASHVHGQGYTDLNFLIPELVSEVDYKKGNYYASVGDFGSAGAFSTRYFDVLPSSFLKIEGGDDGYARLVFATSPKLGPGHLLIGYEMEHDDGPWDRGDNYQKFNGVVAYSVGNAQNGASLTTLAYHGDWNASNQVPVRAINEGLIDRFGEINPSDGGTSARYGVNGEWHRGTDTDTTHVTAFASYYDLELFNDYTYFLNNPVRGDQFEQKERRVYLGLTASQTWRFKLFGFDTENTVGLQERTDFVRDGLFPTEDRVRYGVTRTDHLTETRVGPYLEQKTTWLLWLRTIVGLRADVYNFHDNDLTDHLSGGETAAVVSPKVSLVLGPWHKTELYLNAGEGFHSNDVRGTVGASIGGTAGTGNADVLIKSKGAEVGVRTTLVPGLQSTATLWILDLDSELVFTGDSADNEPSRPSRRWGVELGNFYTPTPWLTLNLDFAYSNARFKDKDPAGPWVPEAIATVLDAGVAIHDLGSGWTKGFYGALRYRFFGPRILIEDASRKSDATSLVYLQLGYKFSKTWEANFEVFNLFDAQDADIDYYYVSRLPGEPAAGVADRHTHPAEPRELRGGVTVHF